MNTTGRVMSGPGVVTGLFKSAGWPVGTCLDIRVYRSSHLSEVVEQIAEDNDQEKRTKAVWFFVPVGLACR